MILAPDKRQMEPKPEMNSDHFEIDFESSKGSLKDCLLNVASYQEVTLNSMAKPEKGTVIYFCMPHG